MALLFEGEMPNYQTMEPEPGAPFTLRGVSAKTPVKITFSDATDAEAVRSALTAFGVPFIEDEDSGILIVERAPFVADRDPLP